MESHWGKKQLFRVGRMLRSKWTTENELTSIFGGSFSNNVVLGFFLLKNVLLLIFSFYPIGTLHMYYAFLVL